MKKNYKDFLLVSSPLLLLTLLFFDIRSSHISTKIDKYASFDQLLTILVFSLTAILFTDFLIRTRKDLLMPWLMVVLIVISLALRVSFFSYQSGDFKDFLNKWYWFIKTNGGFQALRLPNFSDYNLTYLYFLAVLTYLPVNHLIGIKIFSILFDYLSAFMVYKIVKIRYPNSNIPLIAGILYLFIPIPILNGAMWGQCDAIYTYFLLICVYYFLNEKYLTGFVFWVISLMFKLQAVFFILPLILIYFHQKIKLKHILIIPLIFYTLAMPALLFGANILEISVVYFRQTVNNGNLTLLAYNIYQLFPDAPFKLLFIPGLLFSAGIIILSTGYLIVKKISLTQTNILLLCTLSTMLIPFVLPKMHERNFFPAEAMLFLYAFYFPKRWYLPAIMQFLSLNVYHNYFYDTMSLPFWALSLTMLTLIILVAKDFHDIIDKKEPIPEC